MREDTARWFSPGDPTLMAETLATRFAQVYGRETAGVWCAPGRANLNGEHIDFHGGRCLPMAVQYGTYVAAAPRSDGLLRLRTLDAQLDTGVIEVRLADIAPATDHEHDGAGDLPSWTRYVSGVAWALGELDATVSELGVGLGFGADVLIRSTLPIGGGLSSSASLECAAALAFTALGSEIGRRNPGAEFTDALGDEHRAELAQVCIRAEVEIVGAATGGLDQTASLRSTAGTLLSLDARDLSVCRLDLTFLLHEYTLIAVDTCVPHNLVDSAFGSRRAESEAAGQLLGVTRLRDALPDAPDQHDVDQALARFDDQLEKGARLDVLDSQACRRRLQHALTEMLRSETIHDLLTSGANGADHAARTIGEIMKAGHASMRDAAEVSFDLANRVVDTALAEGALGARLIGGGFGGSVLMLVHREGVEKITMAVAHLSPDIRFLAVEPSAAARAMRFPTV